MISWTLSVKTQSKKAGLYKQINQAPKSHFVVFFGKDMSDITERIHPFLVEFTWVTELEHKIYNLLCDYDFCFRLNFISSFFFNNLT